MKKAFIFWLSVIPFTAGVSITLLSINYLIKAYDYGLEFDEEFIWLFFMFFFIGFPMLIYGLNKLSIENQ